MYSSFLIGARTFVVPEGLGKIDVLMLQHHTPCLLRTLWEFVYVGKLESHKE